MIDKNAVNSVRFHLVSDPRFLLNSALDNEFVALLNLRKGLREIATRLRNIGVDRFIHMEPRRGNDFQWMAECYATKPENVTWGQMFDAIDNRKNLIRYEMCLDEYAYQVIAERTLLQAKEATTLGFDSVEKMREHEEWLLNKGKNTAEYYLKWVVDLLKHGVPGRDYSEYITHIHRALIER